jgi:hypothetical protein
VCTLLDRDGLFACSFCVRVRVLMLVLVLVLVLLSSGKTAC